MSDDLSTRIEKRVKEKKAISKSQHKNDFFVQKKEIESAIDNGWAIKIIWETLLNEQKIHMTYKTFAKYVRKVICNENATTNFTPKKAASKESCITPTKEKGFHWDPKPDMSKYI